MANKAGPKKAAYDKRYNARPSEVKRRTARNAARAKMVEAGRAHKGDGKDVDHKKPLSRGGSNGLGNLKMMSPAKNRGRYQFS